MKNVKKTAPEETIKQPETGKFTWKTYNIEVIEKAEEEKIFAATKIYQCKIKGNPVDESRTMTVKISTSNPDRSNDVMSMDGCILDNYLNNPIVSAFHKYDRPSTGRALLVGIGDGYIVSKMEFPPEGANPEADILHKLYTTGFQYAISIGFIPHEGEYNELGGVNYTKWELLEYALVLVPDNAQALRMSIEKGFTPEKYLEESQKLWNEEKKEITSPEPAKTEEKTEETPQVGEIKTQEVVEKDVNQVIALGYLLDELSYFIWYFTESEVSQPSIDKLNQALALVMEVVQDQAVLGQKEIAVPVMKDGKLVIEKAGRAISGKHEDMLKTACDHMKKAAEQVEGVLAAVAVEDPEDMQDGDEKKTVQPTTSYLTKLANSLKSTDKEVGLTLRLLKQIQK
ncbi:MAG TPA: hypothetical protein VH186_06305 [Chloroflexia bacterium]|nr:hypothetical protein [Chloroflexia bacterium]